jgi:hypothetical protein
MYAKLNALLFHFIFLVVAFGCAFGVEPTIVPLPSPPAGQGTFSDRQPLCALTDKWIVATGAFVEPGSGNTVGAAFVYDTATLRFKRRIPITGTIFDIAVEGDLLAVGTPKDGEIAPNAGAVFVFNLAQGTLVQKLTNPTALAGDFMGEKVAMSGQRILASSTGDDTNGADAGAAILFDLDSPSAPRIIRPFSGQAGDRFGCSIAVSGDLAVIGALNDDVRGTDAGAAHLFNIGIEGLAVSSLSTLRASDGASKKFFGRSVAISGNIIAIGSASDLGSADPLLPSALYLFDATTRSQLRRIQAGVSLGSSLALDSGLALSGQAQGALSGSDVFLIDTNTARVVRTFRPFDPGPTGFGLEVKIAGGTGLITDGDDQVFVIRGLIRELPISTLVKTGDGISGAGDRTVGPIDAYQIFGTGSSARVLLQTRLKGNPAGRSGLFGGIIPNPSAITNERSGGSTFSRISQPVCASADSLVFFGQRTGAGINALNDVGIAVSSVSSIGVVSPPNVLYQEGVTLSAGVADGRVIKSFGQLVAGRVGMAFNATLRSAGGPGSVVVTPANDSAAFISNFVSDVPSAVLREGDPGPELGTTIGQIVPRIGIASNGTSADVTAFLSGDPATNFALIKFPSNFVIARKGDVFSGATPATASFRSFLGQATSNGNLFRATLNGASTAENECIATDAFFVGRVVVAQKGSEFPGLPAGVRISRFLHYGGDIISGGVVVHVRLAGPGVNQSNDGAILFFNRGTVVPFDASFRLLMREGATAPDTGGQKIGTIFQIDREPGSGRLAVITSIVGGPAKRNLALWRIDPRNSSSGIRLSLRKQDYHGAAGTASVLTSFKMLIPSEPTGALSKGFGTPVAADRTALVLTFSDGQVIAGPLRDLEAEPEPAP